MIWIIILAYCVCWLVSVALLDMIRIEHKFDDEPLYENFEMMIATFCFWWAFWIILFFFMFIPWLCKKLVVLFTAIIYTFFKRGESEENKHD